MTEFDDVFEDEDNAQTIIINALYKSNNFFEILKETLNIDSVECIEDVVQHILNAKVYQLNDILAKMAIYDT